MLLPAPATNFSFTSVDRSRYEKTPPALTCTLWLKNEVPKVKGICTDIAVAEPAFSDCEIGTDPSGVKINRPSESRCSGVPKDDRAEGRA